VEMGLGLELGSSLAVIVSLGGESKLLWGIKRKGDSALKKTSGDFLDVELMGQRISLRGGWWEKRLKRHFTPDQLTPGIHSQEEEGEKPGGTRLDVPLEIAGAENRGTWGREYRGDNTDLLCLFLGLAAPRRTGAGGAETRGIRRTDRKTVISNMKRKKPILKRESPGCEGRHHYQIETKV